ncbi:MAG: ATP-binding protein [Acholeplasmataceae bacterium]
MDDFTTYIFDVSLNAINAHSKYLKIIVNKNNLYHLYLIDHGCGMTKKELAQIESPFYTTRTTRNVGLGLALMTLLSDQTTGSHIFKSIKHIGSNIHFIFDYHHIDFPTEGDYGLLIADLMANQTLKKLIFVYKNHHRKFKIILKTKNQFSRKKLIENINTEIKRVEG